MPIPAGESTEPWSSHLLPQQKRGKHQGIVSFLDHGTCHTNHEDNNSESSPDLRRRGFGGFGLGGDLDLRVSLATTANAGCEDAGCFFLDAISSET